MIEYDRKTLGAIKGLKELKRVFDMKGANATTIERAITLIQNQSSNVLKAYHDGYLDGIGVK